MRLSSRSVCLAALTATALAMTASPTAANEPMEIYKEASLAHCGGVTIMNSHMPAGGCHVYSYGPGIEHSGHVFGIESHTFTCDISLDLYLDEAGGGYATNFVVYGRDWCGTYRPCVSEGSHAETHANTEGNEAGEHAWPFEMEEIDSGVAEAHITVCFHNGDPIEECEGETDFLIYPVGTSEDAMEMVTADNGDAAGAASLPENAGTFATHCELTGHFDLTPEEELHSNHLGA